MNAEDIERHRKALRNADVFRDLEGEVMEQFLRRGYLLDAKPGDVVFFEKMRNGPGLFVLAEGRVEIFRAQDTTAEVRLNVLECGACFGEYSLMDTLETTASVRALDDVRLFFLPRGDFVRAVESDPVAGRLLYRNLLLMLIARLRQMG